MTARTRAANNMLRSWLGRVAVVNETVFALLAAPREGGPMVFCKEFLEVLNSSNCVPVAVEPVVDRSHDGVCVPFVLTRCSYPTSQPARGKAHTHQLWRYDPLQRKLHIFAEFEVPETELPPGQGSSSYRLLDGPVVIWWRREIVYLYYCDKQLQFTLDLRTFSGCSSGDVKVSVNEFWTFSSPQGEDVIVLILACAVDRSSGMECGQEEGLCLQVRAMDSVKLDVKKTDQLVPSPYCSIATAIALHQCFITDRSSGGVATRHIYLVGTSFHQVVVFERGSMILCINSLESVPVKICSLEVMGALLAVAVMDKDGTVTVFKILSEGGGGRVAPSPSHHKYQSWDGATDILVGDFAGLGHEQLLVVFGSKERDGEIPEFCLTDLVQFTAESMGKEMGAVPSTPCPESLVGALGALQLRKRRGEMHLDDQGRELEQKRDLFERGVHFMRRLENSDQPCSCSDCRPFPDPALVCFLPGRVDPVWRKSVPCSHGSTVRKLMCWQRVTDGQWVAGVVLRNEGQRPLQRIGLSMVVLSSIARECFSKVVWTEQQQRSNCEDVEPAAKKLRVATAALEHSPSCENSLHPGLRICLVARTSLPHFTHNKVEASLVCSWSEPSGGADVRTLGLGRVCLTAEEVADSNGLACSEDCLSLWHGGGMLCGNGPDLTSKQSQDLASLLATRAIKMVWLKSTFTDLLCLPAMLKARLPPYLPVLSTTTRALSGLYQSSSGPLSGVAICIDTDLHTAKLSILHKNDVQLSLLMSILQGSLPEDVKISSKKGDTLELTGKALGCLRRELCARTAVVEDRVRELRSQGARDQPSLVAVEQLRMLSNSSTFKLLQCE